MIKKSKGDITDGKKLWAIEWKNDRNLFYSMTLPAS